MRNASPTRDRLENNRRLKANLSAMTVAEKQDLAIRAQQRNIEFYRAMGWETTLPELFAKAQDKLEALKAGK